MSEIHYANKLKEIIADTIYPMFFHQGSNVVGLIRETNDVLVAAHIQKSRNNSSMYATFTIVDSVCLPNFARKMEIMLPSKFYSGVYDNILESYGFGSGGSTHSFRNEVHRSLSLSIICTIKQTKALILIQGGGCLMLTNS